MFRPEDEESFEFIGEPRKTSKFFLTALEVRKLLSQACTGYLAYVVDKIVETKLKIDDVPLVRYFQRISLVYCPIKILSSRSTLYQMEPISKVSYNMAPAELKELHKQLHELL